MHTFLLDTNIWEYWFNQKSDSVKRSNIEKQVEKLVQNEKKSKDFAWRLGVSFMTDQRQLFLPSGDN